MQQPLGLSIGNISVLSQKTLLNIVITYKAVLGSVIGANISDIQASVMPTTPSSPTKGPTEHQSSDDWKWIAIGVSAGVFVIIVVIVIAYCW